MEKNENAVTPQMKRQGGVWSIILIVLAVLVGGLTILLNKETDLYLGIGYFVAALAIPAAIAALVYYAIDKKYSFLMMFGLGAFALSTIFFNMSSNDYQEKTGDEVNAAVGEYSITYFDNWVVEKEDENIFSVKEKKDNIGFSFIKIENESDSFDAFAKEIRDGAFQNEGISEVTEMVEDTSFDIPALRFTYLLRTKDFNNKATVIILDNGKDTYIYSGWIKIQEENQQWADLLDVTVNSIRKSSEIK